MKRCKLIHEINRGLETTAATAAAVSTAAAATTTAESTTTAAALTRYHGLSFVDGQSSAVVISAIKLGDRCCSFFVRGHFNKAKAFAAA
jgi:heme oxygenase